MTEMIERVARALASAALEPYDDLSKAKFDGDAKAAIEAMREPTTEMVYMAEGYADFMLPSALGNTKEDRHAEMKMAYQVAIDVALGERP